MLEHDGKVVYESLICNDYLDDIYPEEKCRQNFKLFSFPIFWFWAYLMKVIPETRRTTKFEIYVLSQ
jgi:hypothetical protein